MNRREMLTGMAVPAFWLSGCSTLLSESKNINITIFNQTDSEYSIEFQIFQNDSGSSIEDALIYTENIDVEPQNKVQKKSIAKARQVIIQFTVYKNDNRQTDQDHIHFYPPNKDATQNIIFEISSNGVLTTR